LSITPLCGPSISGEDKGVGVSIVPSSPKGEIDPDDLRKALRKNTKAVIVNHGSNIIGAIQPVRAIRNAIGDIPLILDACQTIGTVPIDVELDGIDILCFSCHKALFGIRVLGIVCSGRHRPGSPYVRRTGSRSESFEQPETWPDRYESGTPNTPGIAGLLGGLKFIERTGQEVIAEKKGICAARLVEGLRAIEGVTLYGNRKKKIPFPLS